MVLDLRLLAAATLAAIFWAVPARADVAEERKTDDTWTFWFRDDPLASNGYAPRGGIITAGHRGVRTLLIRPRTQFIREMCKSVEHM
jgi:hypothetical protein